MICGLDSVLFDNGQKDIPLYDSINVSIIILEGFFRQRSCWNGIVNTVKLVIC